MILIPTVIMALIIYYYVNKPLDKKDIKININNPSFEYELE